ncbi:MAG: DNA-binding protein [Desulfobulbus sp.]|nr:DNA-binding protein [Desulfobulbus sp.]
MFSLRKIFVHTALTLTLITPVLVLAEAQPPAGGQASAVQAPLDGVALQGKIAETMDSNGYTYLLLDAAQGKVWVAIPQTAVKVGQEVNCAPGLTMNNFTSKTLNRTFEAIIFSPGVEKDAGAVQAESGEKKDGFSAALQAEQQGSSGGNVMAMGMGTSTGSSGAVVPSSDVNVIKATGPNSYSVGECFEQGKELQGKTVRVRGKVMKVSKMIMGKNWIHIQDGTGNPLKNHHDLVVTSQENPGEGAIVTIEGTLNFERDFGAGYKYEVIVEDGKIEK